MGKSTEVAKTLPRRPEVESAWRMKVNGLKDAARSAGLTESERIKAAYRKLRAVKDELEAAVSENNSAIAAAEELLVEDYTATKRETPYYFDDGARVEVNDALAFQVEDADALMAWVHQEKLERLLSLNAQTRDSIARQRLEGALPLPDGVTASAYSQIRFVGPKRK
jgi:hypothetical protein